LNKKITTQMTNPTAGQDRFRLLFEHSSDAHLIMIGDRMHDCNSAAIKLLKATCKTDVLSKHPVDFSPEYQPDGTLSVTKAAQMDALARKNGFHRFEWYHQKMNGEVFPVEVTLNALEIDGKPALIAVWHDLTELKQKEDALRAANEKMKKDLATASAIQRSLLPISSPFFKGLRASWVFKPCDELGGDMLNVFHLDESHVGLYVLDVTGHGVAASLASVAASHFLSPYSETSFVRNTGRTQTPIASPSEVAEKLNHHFSSNKDYIQLMTLVYGVLNMETREFRYVSAGHPLPILVSSGGRSPRSIEGGGTPIGLSRGFKCEEYSLRLTPGDRLYLYTDGIVEARNTKRDFLGKERFMDTLTRTSTAPLAESLDVIVSETESWSAPQLPADDITVLACELVSQPVSKKNI